MGRHDGVSLAGSSEPSPGTVGKLLLPEGGDSLGGHLLQRGFIINGVAFQLLHDAVMEGLVLDGLGIQIAVAFQRRAGIQAELLERVRHDESGQEAVERLFHAAIGVFRQVGQGFHHAEGDAGGNLDDQLAFLPAPLLRQGNGEFLLLFSGKHHGAPRMELLHAMHQHGEVHLHGVSGGAGRRLHGDGGGSLPDGGGPPVDDCLPLGGNVHFPHGGIVRICGEPLYGRSVSREKFQATVFQGNGNAGADGLVRPVADQGAEHHYVFFHKEARGLHADHEVLRGQEFRGSLPYLQSGGDGPGGGFPGGQVVRHLHRNGNVPFLIRPERAAPLDAVRKIGAQLNVRGTVLLHVCVSLSGCKGITFCAFFIRSHLLHDRNRCGGGDCRSFSQYAACGFSADSIITGSDSCGSKAVDGSFFPPQQIAVVTVEQGLEVGLVRAAVLLRSGGRHFFQAEKAGFVQAPPDGLGDVRNIGACDIFQSLVIDG